VIRFNARFLDGPNAGKTATLRARQFAVGQRIKVGANVYKICDGPVAKSIELAGRGHPNLVVNLRLDEKN